MTPLSGQVSVNRPAPAGAPAGPPAAAPGNASADADALRTALGITVTTSGTDRDTLGLLVASVAAGSAAQHSGVEPGNRIADANGTSVRIGAASVGRREARDDAVRRMADVVRGASDSVALRLFGGGKYRTVFVAVPHKAAPAPAPMVVADPTAHPLTVASVIEIVSEARDQVQRLMEDTLAKPLPLDTLMWVQGQLSLIERRLQATRQAPPPPPPAPAPAMVAPAAAAVAAVPAGPVADTSIPGIRTTAVTDELTDYFGAESRGGILVLDADSSWAPVRKGDVILRINGQRATPDALRAAAADRAHPAQVDLLRRGRYLMVTVHAGG
jgi:S1-C subfamily serine protease